MKRIIHHAKRHYHQRYKEPHGDKAHWVFLFDQFLVGIMLTLLAIGTYYAFFYHPLRDDFRFSVDIPPALAAGEETDVTLRVANNGDRRLHNVLFTAHLPDQFVITRFPENYDPERNVTPVGSIEPGETVNLTMRGMVIGPPAEVPVFVRMIAADDQGVDDERVFMVSVAWKENRINGTFTHPEEIVGNQTFPVTLTVTNGSKTILTDVRVRPHFPVGYQLQVATPPLANGESRIGPIAPGESVELRFSGRTPSVLETFNVSADIVWVTNDLELLLDRPTLEHRAVTTHLDLKAAFTSEAPLRAGEEAPFTVEYANVGGLTLKDVIFSVPLDTRLVDSKDGKLVVGTFETLKPGDRGTLTGTMKVKGSFSQFVENPELVVTPQASLSIPQEKIGRAIVAGAASFKRRVTGTVELGTAARYFTPEGEQLGRGILPPKAGKETRYWIFLSVRTGSSAINDGAVTVTLPENVRWTGRASVSAGGEMIDADGRLTWQVGGLTAHVGTAESQAIASFEVSLIPTTDQIGSPAALMTGAEMTAVDAWSGLALTDTAVGLTTDLKTDSRIKGRVLVNP